MAIQTMRPEEVHAICAQGGTIDLIDVRSEGEYNAIHAVGARNLPIGRLSADALKGLRQTAESEPVYVICQSGGRSQAACNQLHAAGVPRIVNVIGGTGAWEKAGLPVVRGPGAKIEPFIRPAAITGMILSLILAITVHWALIAGMVAIWVAMVSAGRCPLMTVLFGKKSCATGAPQCTTNKA